VATQIDSNNQVTEIPSAAGKRFGIVVAEWNSGITEALYKGAEKLLLGCGAQKEDIIKQYVPGSFELPLGAQFFAERNDIDAVICLGCIIQGETRHFEFIASSVAEGITQVGLKFNKPVAFGVLTTDTIEQARERAGGNLGNKGEEAAEAVLKMNHLKHNIKH